MRCSRSTRASGFSVRMVTLMARRRCACAATGFSLALANPLKWKQRSVASIWNRVWLRLLHRLRYASRRHRFLTTFAYKIPTLPMMNNGFAWMGGGMWGGSLLLLVVAIVLVLAVARAHGRR